MKENKNSKRNSKNSSKKAKKSLVSRVESPAKKPLFHLIEKCSSFKEKISTKEFKKFSFLFFCIIFSLMNLILYFSSETKKNNFEGILNLKIEKEIIKKFKDFELKIKNNFTKRKISKEKKQNFYFENFQKSKNNLEFFNSVRNLENLLNSNSFKNIFLSMKNSEENFQQKLNSIKILNIIIFSINILTFGFLVFIYLFYNIFQQKNFYKKILFSLVSFISFFNILINFEITRNYLYGNEFFFLGEFLLTLIKNSFIYFYLYKICSNFFINFLALFLSNLLIFLFSIGHNWQSNFSFFFLILYLFLYTIFFYIYYKRKKDIKENQKSIENQLKKEKNFIYNLNSGIIIFNNDNFTFDYNRKYLEIIQFNNINPKFECFKNYFMQYYLFLSITEFNSYLDNDILDIFKKFKDIFCIIDNTIKNLKNFTTENLSELMINLNDLLYPDNKSLENYEELNNNDNNNNNNKLQENNFCSNNNNNNDISYINLKFNKLKENNININLNINNNNITKENLNNNKYKIAEYKQPKDFSNNSNDNDNENENKQKNKKKSNSNISFIDKSSRQIIIGNEIGINNLINNNNNNNNELNKFEGVCSELNKYQIKEKIENIIKNIIQNFLEILIKKLKEKNSKNILNNKNDNNNFFLVGNGMNKFKLYKKQNNISDNQYQIFVKLNNCNTLEFHIFDITSVIESEDYKAQNKYKKIFLNKFSHEFRNPILNISQLIQNIKNKIKDNLPNLLENDRNNLNKDFNSDIKEDIKHIKSICNFMSLLISDFDYLANVDLSLKSQNLLEDGEIKMESYNDNKNRDLDINIEQKNSNNDNNENEFDRSDKKLDDNNKVNKNNINNNIDFKNIKKNFNQNNQNKNQNSRLNISNNYNSSNNNSLNPSPKSSLQEEKFIKIIDYNNNNYKNDDESYYIDNIKFDLNKLITNLIKIFQCKISLSEKKVKISYLINKKIPLTLFLDQNKIKQILFNLLSNSFKFTINGLIRLDVSLEENLLIFSVKDTGKGLSKVCMNNIGKPFSMSTSFNNNFGIGMGLHIVQKNIKILRGQFYIESNLGSGTLISAKIPIDPKINFCIPKKNMEKTFFQKYEQIIPNNKIKSNFFKKNMINLKSLNNKPKTLMKLRQENQILLKSISSREKENIDKIEIISNNNKNENNIKGENDINDKEFDKTSSYLEGENFKKHIRNNSPYFKKKKGFISSKELPKVSKFPSTKKAKMEKKDKEKVQNSNDTNEVNIINKKKTINFINEEKSPNNISLNKSSSCIQKLKSLSINDLIMKYAAEKDIENIIINNENEGKLTIDDLMNNDNLFNFLKDKNLNDIEKDLEVKSLEYNYKSNFDESKSVKSDSQVSQINKSMIFPYAKKNLYFSSGKKPSSYEIKINTSSEVKKHYNNSNKENSDYLSPEAKNHIPRSIEISNFNCDKNNNISEANEDSCFSSENIKSNSNSKKLSNSNSLRNKIIFDDNNHNNDYDNINNNNDLQDSNDKNKNLINIDNEIDNEINYKHQENNNINISNIKKKSSSNRKFFTDYIDNNKMKKIGNISYLNLENLEKNNSDNYINDNDCNDNNHNNIDIDENSINKSCRNLFKESFQEIDENENENESNRLINILVVDDEKLIRQSEINVLKKFEKKNKKNFYIEECTDGVECLFKLYQGINQGRKYDIILTDETMNFMKGSTMCSVIRSLISLNVLYKLKIYMVTSYESSTIPEHTKKDFDKILTKPLTISMLDNIPDLN